MQYPDFSNARAGDRVYSVVYGWGTVREIDRKLPFPLRVLFDIYADDPDFHVYPFNGKFSKHDPMPTLFWSEIPIPPEALTPPKRTRKETRWFFVFFCEGKETPSDLYTTKTCANTDMKRFHALGQGPFPVEIEVEE